MSNYAHISIRRINLPDTRQIWMMDFYKYLLILSSVYR